jgi:hypothetical protein
MADLRFVDAVLDASLIPDVFNGCDQWCDYCPFTARCLAYRCRPAGAGSGSIYHDIAAAMYEALGELKASHDSAGTPLPAGLEHLLASDPRETTKYVPVDDPLERLGRRHAMLAAAYLMTRRDAPREIPRRPSGPTPLDVLARYHLLIAMKIYRAVVTSAAAARAADEELAADAGLSVKVALVCADRTDEALACLGLDDVDPRIEQMRANLRRLRRDLEARFPDARGRRRPGFDEAP